jgi:hypothetical protein
MFKNLRHLIFKMTGCEPADDAVEEPVISYQQSSRACRPVLDVGGISVDDPTVYRELAIR